MRTKEYIEKVKEVKGLDTDYKVNKYFGWPSNRITKYKDGHTMDNESARQIAEVLEIPLMKVVADMEIERFEKMGKKEKAKVWSKLANKSLKEAGEISFNLLFLLPFLSFLATQVYILCKIAYENIYIELDVSNHIQA